MTVALSALPQFLDNQGNPLSGGLLYSYAAGTLTPLATYTDRSGSTANSNPVVLDSAGRTSVWLTANVPFKLILRDAGGTVIASVDNYYAGADPQQLQAAGIVPSTGGTYTGLVSFTGGVTFDGDDIENEATRNSLGIASVQNRNLWTNSDFQINQRVAATASDGAYGFDRTAILCDGGSVTLTSLAQPTDGIPAALRMTQPDATAKRIGHVQIVEARGCIAYRGKKLVFAPKFRASVNTTMRVALVAWTGAVDTPIRDLINSWTSTNYTAGNFFIANTLTIAVGSTSVVANAWTDVAVSSASAGGVVAPSTMNNLYLVSWTDLPVAQNVTIDSSVMRAGQGTAIPVWTPPDPAMELQRCLRYYSKSYAYGTAPSTGTSVGSDQGYGLVGGSILTKIQFPSLMRVPPTIVLWSNNGAANQWVAFTSGGVATSYSASVASITERNASVTVTPGASEVSITGQWAATAEL